MSSLFQDNPTAMSFDRIAFGETGIEHGDQTAGINLDEENE